MRIRLQDFADLTTLAQGLIALVGAGALAVVAQKIGEVVLGLSTAERVILGICLFLLLLAVFLSRVKVFREWRASRKSDIDRLSTALEDLQHRYDEMERKQRETEQDRDSLQRQYDAERGTKDWGERNARTLATLSPADAKELKELRAEVRRLRVQPGDEALKGECFQVSTDCYQFVRDHGGTEHGDYLDPEVRRRNDEVMLEYDESLGGRVNGLFRKLQRRGWWQPEKLEPKKRKRIEDPGFLSDVHEIARELNAIGHEH